MNDVRKEQRDEDAGREATEDEAGEGSDGVGAERCTKPRSPDAASVPRPRIRQVRLAGASAISVARSLLDLGFRALLAARIGCIGARLRRSCSPRARLVACDSDSSFAANNLPSAHRLGGNVGLAARAAAHRRAVGSG